MATDPPDSTFEQEALQHVGPELAAALARLARGRRRDFEALLGCIDFDEQLPETHLRWHCYTLQLDGNGLPRLRNLLSGLIERIVDFAIPRKAFEAAEAEYARTNSAAPYTRLALEARQLFTPSPTTGEVGELLLFAFAESVLGLPQLLCKMDLKTDESMHVHGADGIHVGVDQSTQRLRLYWGESKVKRNRSAAISECFSSIGPILKGEGGADMRDRQLIMRSMNIPDPALESAMRNFLDPNQEYLQHVADGGLCLVSFNCTLYPSTPSELKTAHLHESIKSAYSTWRQAVLDQARDSDVDQYHIHVLCVPFASVNDLRNTFLELLFGTNQ